MFFPPPRNLRPELLDLDEAPFEEVRDSLEDVRLVNKYLSGYKVLLHYIRNEATTKIPVWRMISISVEELDRRVQTWQKMIGDAASVTEGQSVIGGGSLPEETLRSKLPSIDPS